MMLEDIPYYVVETPYGKTIYLRAKSVYEYTIVNFPEWDEDVVEEENSVYEDEVKKLQDKVKQKLV